MAELSDFHGLQPGADKYRYANYYGTEDDLEAGEKIEAGEAVTIGGDGKIYPLNNGAGDNTDSGIMFGVAYTPAEVGETPTVKTNGGVIAKVPTDVTEGDTVGSGTNADGTGVANSAGDQYIVVQYEDADLDGDDTDERYAELSEL